MGEGFKVFKLRPSEAVITSNGVEIRAMRGAGKSVKVAIKASNEIKFEIKREEKAPGEEGKPCED